MKARVKFLANFREAVNQFHHFVADLHAASKKPLLFLLQSHQTAAINQAPLAHSWPVFYNRPIKRIKHTHNTTPDSDEIISYLLSYAIPAARES